MVAETNVRVTNTPNILSFNEAATNWSRKPGYFLTAEYSSSIPSMRPRPIGRGNVGAAGRRQVMTMPSMRPRPIGRGNKNTHLITGPLLEPSMRPRPIGRGNVTRRFRYIDAWATFNEAATNWSRKQTAFAAELRGISLLPSMRPRPIGRGNPITFYSCRLI